MTVSFPLSMCHVGILLTRVGHLHDCVIPSIYVSCRDFTHTGSTPTRMYHSPHLCVMQGFHSHGQDTYMTVSFPLFMCHVGILLTRVGHLHDCIIHLFMCHVEILLILVGHLHDCIIPSIYVSCRDFTHGQDTYMTVSFPLFMCHVGILLTRVGHLQECIIPPIYVSCRYFTHTSRTPT